MANKSYKTVVAFLKHLNFLAMHQDMSGCKDWNKLSEKEQKLFYAILASIQNDLGEMKTMFCEREALELIKAIDND